MNFRTIIRLAGVLYFISSSLFGQILPAGTTFEARFWTATGSAISHREDQVAATVISPVMLNGSIAIPQGARLRGRVEKTIQLGFGIKHRTASIQYRFSELDLNDGQRVAMEASLIRLETAKERVTEHGEILGVHPIANLSSAANLYTLPLTALSPAVGAPIWGLKAVIAPSTSPELYLPSGTEFIVRLETDLDVSALTTGLPAISRFSMEAAPLVSALLEGNTDFRAQLGKKPSDLVNLLFVGTREQIDQGFQAAGWVPAERKSPVALYRMYNALTQRIGYRRAPMNKLSLNSKRSDFVYQKSLNTIAKRHHVRFWKQTPSGNLWLGAATEDVSLQFRWLHWTHLIDPVIDHERAKVVNDLAFTGCIGSAALLKRQMRRKVNEKPAVITDGEIAAVQFNGCENAKAMPGAGKKSVPLRTRWWHRAMMSFRDDLVRANPLFTSYNMIRSMAHQKDERIAGKDLSSGAMRPGLDWMKKLQPNPPRMAKSNRR